MVGAFVVRAGGQFFVGLGGFVGLAFFFGVGVELGVELGFGVLLARGAGACGMYPVEVYSPMVSPRSAVPSGEV